eukprot:CAMPEP_0114590966 /NCGR_PEP_ID=MMETSP0125-20121206/13121_1 /TAXON_ID=485358 ORGANISM="Aristerostoma sp., Strain ATCC 50986" /NCGR_SAMPLE_ID=MMETSP0125 /ASSEMBLY_ACC=CAM_ASM_000245 /LENGTH=83 /DNA_ID=CAMNT_0001788795 /DNA_START=1073 /DNA_END=1324 /DNA_ORIENTATION=-
MTNAIEEFRKILLRVFMYTESTGILSSEKLVSYTRLILTDTADSFGALNFKIFTKMRRHIRTYYQKRGLKSPINLESNSTEDI